MRTIVAIALSALLSGCMGNPFTAGQELAVPTNFSEAGQEAAKLINGAKVTLIVSENTVNQQAKEGLVLKSEATEARAWINERWKQVKDAEALLSNGKDVLAKGEAELIEKALAEFQRQLMARAAVRAAAKKRGAT